jgi:hypothetical protein
LSYKNIKELPYRIYDGLPLQVKKFIRPMMGIFFFRNIFFLISQLRPSVFLLQGKEKGGGENLSILFFGDEKRVSLLSDLLYSGEPKKESLGKVFIWRMKSRMNSALHRVDLVFIIMEGFSSRFLSWQGFIIIPEWVLFRLDLSKSFPEAWNLSKSKNKSLRENLREFRRHNFSYEIAGDPGKFEYFYHHMYLPYITKRFEELTFLTGVHDMERVFRKGWLLLVKKGDDYVSGIMLIRLSRDTIFAHSLGITEGNIEYFKTGALTAVYYFSILWAKERGYRWIDFGHGGSFLRYGLFNHKKHWGMEIKISRRFRNIFGIKICNFSHGVQNLLEENPFIFIDQRKLKRLILVKNKHNLSLKEAQACIKTYSVPGLDCLVIVSDQGFDQEAKEFANSCSTPRVQLANRSVFAP